MKRLYIFTKTRNGTPILTDTEIFQFPNQTKTASGTILTTLISKALWETPYYSDLEMYSQLCDLVYLEGKKSSKF